MNPDRLNELKEEYNQIHADDAYKERLANMMKKEHTKRSIWKKTAAAAACVGVLTVGLNVSPSLAYAMSEIPVVDSIVRVLTFNRYEIDEGNYQATVVTPQIEGLLDEELENELNEKFKDEAQQVIAAFESSIKELEAEYGEGNFHEGIEYNYTIKTDNEDMLALDVYLYGASGSSWVKHTYYNIDKKTGELLEFKDLFQDGADYTTPIDAYITGEMERRNQEEDGMFWLPGGDLPGEGFETIGENPKFYINDAGNIVICFDKYEVAAGAQGSPEFEIPHDVIADILK